MNNMRIKRDIFIISELLGIDCDIDFYDKARGHLSHYPSCYTTWKYTWTKRMNKFGKQYLIDKLEELKGLM